MPRIHSLAAFRERVSQARPEVEDLRAALEYDEELMGAGEAEPLRRALAPDALLPFRNLLLAPQ